MKSSEKLKLIKQLSKLSQEQLARELNVSFATLNSWINNRSAPRPGALVRIDTLYREQTGQKIIPPDLLSAKKTAVMEKTKKYRNILKIILDHPDIRDQFILSLTYNSNSIEGSTLTEPETAAVLFDNTALPNKSLLEQLEAKNHQAALNHLWNWLGKKNSIDEDLIQKLHSILMNSIRDDAGYYRHHAVRIAGANVPTANYLKVPMLMEALVRDLTIASGDIIQQIASVHSRFEQIHPFSDGNGRIGRLLMTAMALQTNLPPPVVEQQKKRLYYSVLNKAQQTGELSLLEDFICNAFFIGFEIIEQKTN